MKLFAVVRNEAGSLELKSWRSRSAFESEHSYMDACIVDTATTEEYKQGHYQEEREHIDFDAPMREGERFRAPVDKDKVEAHNMLHRALKTHFKGQVFMPDWD